MYEFEFESLKEWSLSWHCVFDLEVVDVSGACVLTCYLTVILLVWTVEASGS
jgi:hypothetical protein